MSLEVNDSNFSSEVLNSETPVLVDFWAPWCGPCRMIAPVLEELSQEYAGKLKICKLNVDDNPVTASSYNIMSIPTLILFRAGMPIGKIMGALPKQAIKAKLSEWGID